MTTFVAVIAAGEMGCSIGERLRRHGARVLTSLAHRSAATLERASGAGMIDADDDEIAASDFILPSFRRKMRWRLRSVFRAHCSAVQKKATYVDCNAVSVETVATIEKLIAASGARFVDGSIIGAPGRQDQVARLSIWPESVLRMLRP